VPFSQGEVLGLIAGEGVLPLLGARSARAAGRKLACVAFRDLADPALAECTDALLWVAPGEVLKALAFLREQGVCEAVLAGKVAKGALLADPASLGLDERAREGVDSLPDLGDATLLSRVADWLGAAGITLLPQGSLAPDLLAGEGPLGKLAPTPEQLRDIQFGVPLARAIAGLDIGQSIVVKRGAVLAVEAIEGTDAALRRGGAVAPGAVAIKVAKPGQDPRFDVPAIGPRTVATLVEAGVAVLAFEAGGTLVLERERVVRDADAAGIAILGIRATHGERA
jgi:DUF1009 family protein